MRALCGLALALAELLGVGCVNANLTDGNAVPEDRIASILPGTTTKAEILDWFGSPESFTDPGELRRLIEESEILPEEVLELPLADVLVFQLTRVRLRGLFLLLYNHLDVRSASNRLVVFFDDQDRVLYYGWRKGADALE